MSQTPPSIQALVDSYKPVTPASIIVVGALLPTLAFIAVGARVYVKVNRRSTLGFDDWLIIFSLVLCIALGLTMVVGSAVHVLGQPTPLGEGPTGFLFVTTHKITTTFKIKYAFNITQAVAFGTIKLSVLFFYRRLFRGKWFNLVSWAMISLIVVWTIGFTFAYVFQCNTNFFALWTNLYDLLEYCFDDILFQRVLAISDVVTDLLILSIPIPCVWALQLSTERRLAICGVFLTGALVIAFGVVRLEIIWKKLGDGFSSSQGILLMSTWFYWTIIEMSIAIVAACLPTLKPLFSKTGAAGSLSNAIQNMFSLRSLSSKRDGSKGKSNDTYHDGASSSSQTNFASSNVYANAVGDIENQLQTVPGKITVQHELKQISTDAS